MASKYSNGNVTYFLNVKIKREIHLCHNCKAPNAWITSAHYPGKYFCTIACLWKHDAVDKKTIRTIGLPRAKV